MSEDTQTQDTSTKTNQMVIFKLSGEVFASDINEVREVIKFDNVTPVPDSRDYVAGIVNIRGKIVPVIDLAIVLKIGAYTPDKQAYILLINGPDNAIIGMLVDSVSEIRRFTAEEIKPAPKLVKSKVEAEFISGVILPSGEQNEDKVILLIDLAAIISDAVIQAIDQVKLTQQEASTSQEEEHENTNS